MNNVLFFSKEHTRGNRNRGFDLSGLETGKLRAKMAR